MTVVYRWIRASGIDYTRRRDELLGRHRCGVKSSTCGDARGSRAKRNNATTATASAGSTLDKGEQAHYSTAQRNMDRVEMIEAGRLLSGSNEKATM